VSTALDSGRVASGDALRRLTGAPRPRRRRARRLTPRPPLPAQRLLGPLLLLALWYATSAAGWLNPEMLSSPVTVAETTGDLIADGRLQSNLLASLNRAGLGLVLGVAIGLGLALAAGLTRTGDALLDGSVQIKRAIPNLALIPLAIIWLGIGEGMKVTIIALGVFIPIYINTHASLRGIDNRYVELAETVRLSRASFIGRVVLPGALPGFFVGLRLAVTHAWTALVVVEQVNATEGIGFLMTQARIYGQTEIVLVGLVVYGVLGLTSDTLVRAIERKALAWRQSLAS
jgi:sulfonate transport system permease protein